MKTLAVGHNRPTKLPACLGESRITLLLTLLLTALPITCHALDITFRPAATVTHATINLADIADFNRDSELAKALAEQTVAVSPEAGEKNVFDSHSIIKKLSKTLTPQDNINWQGAKTVTVERLGVAITPKTVQETIEAYISSRAKELPKARYTFTAQDPPLPFIVPTGDLKWEVIPSNPDVVGSSRFALIGRIDNQVVKNFSIRGTLEALAPVAVAATNLRHEDIITASQVQMEPRDLSTLRSPCLQAGQLVGKKLLRNIKAGSVIDLASVDFPPMVTKGMFVKIRGQGNGLELTATGFAKTSGKEGEIIKVKNASSDKEIFCRVTAPGLVEVQI